MSRFALEHGTFFALIRMYTCEGEDACARGNDGDVANCGDAAGDRGGGRDGLGAILWARGWGRARAGGAFGGCGQDFRAVCEGRGRRRKISESVDAAARWHGDRDQWESTTQPE